MRRSPLFFAITVSIGVFLVGGGSALTWRTAAADSLPVPSVTDSPDVRTGGMGRGRKPKPTPTVTATPSPTQTITASPDSTISASSEPTETASPPSGAHMMGVYRGGSSTQVQRILSYEGFLGRSVDLVLVYQPYDAQRGWAGQEWPTYLADAWAGFDRRLVIGSTAFPDGGSWASAAAGAYDAYWASLGRRLVASSQGDAIIRFAHEMNVDGTEYPWRVKPSQVDDYVKAYRRFVSVMRGTGGNSFQFTWNPNVGQESYLPNADQAYPGDGYVDHIGLDVYDGWYRRGWTPGTGSPPSTAERDAVWNTILNGDRGIKWWRSFAAAHNKPLAYPEWGLRLWIENDGQSHGGGDNAAFIARMTTVINSPVVGVDGVSRATAYHAFWEKKGFGISDADDEPARTVGGVPLSRGAFLGRW